VDVTTGTTKKVTVANLGAAWTTWNPTTANITAGNGVFSCAYIQIGKTVHCRFKFTLGDSSAIGTSPTVTLPVTAAGVTQSIVSPVYLNDIGTTYYIGMVNNDTNASILSLYVLNAAGTYATAVTGLTSTVPHTWAVNDTIFFNVTYQAA
jgi:hypothetical protein